MSLKTAIRLLAIALLLAGLYLLARSGYWRGSGPAAPLQEPMHYVDQYKYPRPWTRAQLAPGVPEPTPFAAVYGPNVVGQQWRSCCANLALLRIWLGGAAGQRVTLSLRSGPDEAETLYATTLTLTHDGYHDLIFPPQPDSAGKSYYLFVSAPQASAGQAVALRVMPGDRLGGVPWLNEYPAAGNLDLAAYHHGRPGGWLLAALVEQILPQAFATRLQQYKPDFFKGHTFGWLLAAMVGGLLVWLVVAWPGERRRMRRRLAALAAAALAMSVLLAAASGALRWPRRATALTPPTAPPGRYAPGAALVYDLLLSLYPAEKLPERRFFAAAWAEVNGQRQPCIVAPPDSTLSYGLRLPPEAALRLTAALPDAAARRRFEVSLGSGETLFSQELHGPETSPATLDLSAYGGQQVRLLLRTVAPPDETAPGLWCAPQIESARGWLRPYPWTAEDSAAPLAAIFDEALELLGYRLDVTDAAPGGQVKLTLYWHARQRVTTDYTVFVHLLDEAEAIRGQRDSQPVDGAYPTTLWSPEQVVVDRHVVPVASDAPPGRYRLALGLYDLATLQRLPVYTAESGVADRLLLEPIVVAPR